ncbi:hypothetical protein EL17_18120 [Anditalea andensis]|uniref:Uncharacterized protein n=1 Tax=Anditalea andensis TaxID=1048983 RepID=A0A074KRT7_9BACT|nr:hypothetical protein EL17_18120 [Anditalea andensis]
MTTEGKGTTIYIGGQDAVNEMGEIVGKGELAKQTEKVIINIKTALSACGATFDNLLELTFYMVEDQYIKRSIKISQEFFGHMTSPPVVSVLLVSGLAHPDFPVEIEGTAFIPG